jgi:hypothetical protein
MQLHPSAINSEPISGNMGVLPSSINKANYHLQISIKEPENNFCCEKKFLFHSH